ncbi:MAG: c-type cytochrome [Dehalococcoidia bacterium]|nr:c-type cytochrome [Dehalococcoidia bacterium]MDW8119982.1 c-type cytochrome [Chloroflexota bacterium]
MLRLALIGLAVGVVVFLTACGGGGAAQPAPTPTPRAGVTPAARTPTPARTVAAGDVNRGKQVYAGTCAVCHGQNAEGVQGLGVDLRKNEFIQRLTDAQLLDFLKVGRAADAPDNRTKVAMPPKGGNPALTDRDLQDVIAFLRTLQ